MRVHSKAVLWQYNRLAPQAQVIVLLWLVYFGNLEAKDGKVLAADTPVDFD
jgi:hypothetical protein